MKARITNLDELKNETAAPADSPKAASSSDVPHVECSIHGEPDDTPVTRKEVFGVLTQLTQMLGELSAGFTQDMNRFYGEIVFPLQLRVDTMHALMVRHDIYDEDEFQALYTEKLQQLREKALEQLSEEQKKAAAEGGEVVGVDMETGEYIRPETGSKCSGCEDCAECSIAKDSASE